MPELPEVDTVAWRLREGGHGEQPLVGRTFVSFVVDDATVLRSGDAGPVDGARVVDVTRRAKWITIHVAPRSSRASGGATTTRLLVHLVMTGDLHVVSSLPARFVRWHARLDDGTHLVFTDPRKFGHLDIVDDDAPFFCDLGVEPLSSAFSAAAFAPVRGARRAVKAVLLDQSVVVGLGNIWADESLHVARIDPRRPMSTLSDDELLRLCAAVRTTLATAIAEARTELVWRYGDKSAPSPFRVYDRSGEPCRACATALSSTKIAGRTTVWCERCQPPVR
jgi:formamidopyrimidine-DNA glycosylase